MSLDLVGQRFSKCGPQTVSISVTWEFQILRPHPELLNQKLWGRSPANCFNKPQVTVMRADVRALLSQRGWALEEIKAEKQSR